MSTTDETDNQVNVYDILNPEVLLSSLNAEKDPREIEASENMQDKVEQDADPSIDSLEIDNMEKQHFFDIFNTFRNYKKSLYHRISVSRKFMDQMSLTHQKKLVRYREHLEQLEGAVSANYELIKLITSDVANMFQNAVYMDGKEKTLVVKEAHELDTDRLNSVLSQIVREWTAEGAVERDTCFGPILKALEQHFSNVSDPSKVKILVPGCGLGRLPFEIAQRGFSCEGNEFSLMMLFVSNFILNKCEPNCCTFFPWVSHFSNNLTSSQQLAQLTFPDISLSNIPANVKFSMAAGSFTEIYANAHQNWDCVVTCFFLDTAPSLVNYIELIADILQADGIWINFGPLLYHHLPDSSVEPSYEIVRDIILESGFVFIEEKTNQPSYYTRNPNSMLSYEYKSVFFVCKKSPTC